MNGVAIFVNFTRQVPPKFRPLSHKEIVQEFRTNRDGVFSIEERDGALLQNEVSNKPRPLSQILLNRKSE